MLRLEPHPSQTRLPDLDLQVRLSRSAGILSLSFHLRDPQAEVLLPDIAEHPERRDGLWRTTCFELFLAQPGHSSYHELNLSPAGHWNLLHFRETRQAADSGWTPQELAFQFIRRANGGELTAELPLEPLGLADGPLRLGVCAVLDTADSGPTHWALVHPMPHPDFHDPRGFVLKIT